MSKATSSRHGHRVQRVHPAVEVLEDRTLPSVTILEAEPNDTRAHANVIARVVDTPVTVSGKVGNLGDRDWFKIQLQAGDVLGAALKGKNGLDPKIRLVNSAGDLMIANNDANQVGATYLPRESPLPHGHVSDTDAEIYYVISTAGTYYFKVSASGNASAGKYNLDLMVARPGLERQPVGTRQILFLDFNGARVNFSHFPDSVVGGNRTLSPLSRFLPDWGLTPADEDALIDAIVANVADKLSTYVGANGLNGDFAATGIQGQFGIEIRNSRDDPDEFGTNPFVSRVVVGGTKAEAGFPPDLIGMAEDLDVGNFKTNDEAVATLDFAPPLPFPVQAPLTSIDFIATGVGALVAKEAAHFFGCFHTDQDLNDPFAGTPNLMEPGIVGSLIRVLGPDFVLGTEDDGKLQLGVDRYYREEVFRGLNDTLNTVAFGLSTGKAAGARFTGIRSNDGIPPTSTGSAWRYDLGAALGWFGESGIGRSSEVVPGDMGDKGQRGSLGISVHGSSSLVGQDHDANCRTDETLSGGTDGQGVAGVSMASGTLGIKNTKVKGNHASSSSDNLFGSFSLDC